MMKLSLKANNYYFKEILAFLFLLLAAYFFRKQRAEIVQAGQILQHAVPTYVLLGIVVTGVYITLHGLMYVYSFKAVQANISVFDGVKLFLKRNLVSVFLPGGGITSLAFFTADIEKKGISKSRIGFASYIFGIVGIASLAIIALPVLLYLAAVKSTSDSTWAAFAGLILLILLLVLATRSFLKKGWVFNQLYKLSPQFEGIVEEISLGAFSLKKIIVTLVCSLFVEVCGILHLYIAMKALGISAGLESCIAGYVIATLFFAISPFLRGLGAVEVSLIFVLRSYGISNIDSISITVLYRVFEFWLTLLAGLAAFGFSRGNILLRILPATLLALLGLVNIISVLTPPLVSRLHFLQGFLPMNAIHLSNLATLIAGIMLLCCATFLIRGLRNAWLLALVLCVISLIGNLSKAIDYEEASVALLAIIVLVATRRNYRLKSDPKVRDFGIQTSLIILLSVIVYGVIGFYFLDAKEFGVDFSFTEAVKSTLNSFLLLSPNPAPLTRFATGFVHSINLLGAISIGLLLYAFVKPFIFKTATIEEEQEKAIALLERFGRSADDYFKSYEDKSFFFGTATEGFIAYKIARGFAVALGDPVCENNAIATQNILKEFERFCLDNGLKTAYYKIDQLSLPLYYQLGKKSLPIGQEAIVDLNSFTLEGKDRKSLRNAINALERKGFRTVLYQPPIKDGLLQKLKLVSDNWLHSLDRKEIVFSSGMFNWDELKEQPIITIENEDEKVVAFLNVIPDYVQGEGTYDLIRKTEDAPSGVMDALIVKLIEYLKENGSQALNMGVASMSGIDKPKDVPEWVIKFAYERLSQFRHYHGLYEFKAKYANQWMDKYLVYENHYDLLSLPLVLSRVMKDNEI